MKYPRPRKSVEYAAEVQYQPGGRWCIGRDCSFRTADGAHRRIAELRAKHGIAAGRVVEVTIIKRVVTIQTIPHGATP